MSKFYKPNHSTILYLNTSFNCVKSSSITLTKTSGGSGYTSAPTIQIIPASGDNGSGCIATCTVVSGSVDTITIVNNGQNYSALPTITLSGGTPTVPAVITPSFKQTYTYTWNIPDIIIHDLAKLSVINIIATGTSATTPYTYRINGLQYDSRDSFFSDYGSPILSIAQNTNVCGYGSLSENKFAIILTQQLIRQISISVDDDITKKSSGQLSSINFVIGLQIEEYDPITTEIGDPYGESFNRLKKSR